MIDQILIFNKQRNANLIMILSVFFKSKPNHRVVMFNLAASQNNFINRFTWKSLQKRQSQFELNIHFMNEWRIHASFRGLKMQSSWLTFQSMFMIMRNYNDSREEFHIVMMNWMICSCHSQLILLTENIDRYSYEISNLSDIE
jgi:hypothetical protein